MEEVALGGGGGGGGAMTFAGNNMPALDPALLRYLSTHQGKARYLVATATSSYASLFILATNQPVMALGGYQGWDRVVTPTSLAQLVTKGTVRFFYLPAIQTQFSPSGNQRQPSDGTQTNPRTSQQRGTHSNPRTHSGPQTMGLPFGGAAAQGGEPGPDERRSNKLGAGSLRCRPRAGLAKRDEPLRRRRPTILRLWPPTGTLSDQIRKRAGHSSSGMSDPSLSSA